jgi:hypothetical protein
MNHRNKLVDGFVLKSKLLDDTKSTSLVHLPLRSNRLILLNRPKDYLDHDSQRFERREIESDLRKRFQRVEKIIKTTLLKRGLKEWKLKSLMDYRFHYRKFVKLTRDPFEIPSDQWFKHKGCQTIAVYFYDFGRKRLLRSFHRWRQIIREENSIFRRFFDKWMVKASRWKLLRLNAQRLIYKTRRLVNHVRKANCCWAFQLWRSFTEWKCYFIRMKLLFCCWKTVVTSEVKKRRKLYRYGMQQFRLFHERSQLEVEDMLMQVQRLLNRRILLKIWQWWYHRMKSRQVLMRLLHNSRSDKLQKFRAFQLWKRYRIILLSPKKSPMKSPTNSMTMSVAVSSPHKNNNKKPQSGVKSGKKVVMERAVFQTGSDNKTVRRRIVHEMIPLNHTPSAPASSSSAHRRRCSASKSLSYQHNAQHSPHHSHNNQHPHQHHYSTQEIRQMTLLDKIVIRLNHLKEFEESFEEQQQQSFLSIPSAAVSAVGSSFSTPNQSFIRHSQQALEDDSVVIPPIDRDESFARK